MRTNKSCFKRKGSVFQPPSFSGYVDFGECKTILQNLSRNPRFFFPPILIFSWKFSHVDLHLGLWHGGVYSSIRPCDRTPGGGGVCLTPWARLWFFKGDPLVTNQTIQGCYALSPSLSAIYCNVFRLEMWELCQVTKTWRVLSSQKRRGRGIWPEVFRFIGPVGSLL